MSDALRIEPMDPDSLEAARAVLRDGCAFDEAAAVANEKLITPGPQGPVLTWLAWIDDAVVGVVAVSARWLRVLAVRPEVRQRGIGAALLAVAEDFFRAEDVTRARALDQPGNYLAPGVDARNKATIAWLERRGWVRAAEPVTNLLIDVRTNPRVSAARAHELAEALRDRGYEIRRATREDREALLAAVATEFGGAWPWELDAALTAPGGVFVASKDDAIAGFAAHDGNNRGLGWFGPAGTWPAHRGQGVGEALLMACLVEVARAHEICEVAWIGPRNFYDRVAGIAGERQFWPMTRSL
ncbi:MAG: GNAT family N-acetyltransferase [Deltaproteobacteria bacterium]|nr:GNAT family N-acetyltransferase [Deltaproteobacteria bacterium]